MKCKSIAVHDPISKVIALHYFFVEAEVKDTVIEEMFHKMFSTNFKDNSSSALRESNCEVSIKSRRFMKMMKKKCAQEGNHDKFPLPLRDPDNDYSNSRKMADMRLCILNKRFKHDKEFQQDHNKFMHDMYCVKSVHIRSYSGLHFSALRISPYSVQMKENADQNNSEYMHFLRSDNKQKLCRSPR